jgi:hypothetical protein
MAMAFIAQQREIINKKITYENDYYHEIDINKYIEKFSKILCSSMNRFADRNDINIRFLYNMSNKSYGTFHIFTVNKHETIDKDVFIYVIQKNSTGIVYYFIKYNETLHLLLQCDITDIKTINTTIIDGSMNRYSVITSTFVNNPHIEYVDRIDIEKLINTTLHVYNICT